MPAARLRFAIGRVQALGGLLASMPRRLPVCHAASRDIQTTLCVSASMHALSTRVCAKRSLQFLYKSPYRQRGFNAQCHAPGNHLQQTP